MEEIAAAAGEAAVVAGKEVAEKAVKETVNAFTKANGMDAGQ